MSPRYIISILLLVLFSNPAFASLTLNEVYQRAVEQDVPEQPLEEALAFFHENEDLIGNREFVTLIDFELHSGEERMYIIDMVTGVVDRYLVAHGRNSDPDHDGYATRFSNTPQSKQTSLGFYLVAERYFGKHGLSVRMDGLSVTNSNARKRAIVMHGADYVSPNRSKMGRSWGCPAVERRYINEVVSRLEGDSLLYAFVQD